jgi:integrase
MGHKTSKGSISISNYKGRVRLRWRYQKKRYSLNHFPYNKANLQQAKKIAVQSERGLLTDNFDFTLRQYKPTILQERAVGISKSLFQLYCGSSPSMWEVSVYCF